MILKMETFFLVDKEIFEIVVEDKIVVPSFHQIDLKLSIAARIKIQPGILLTWDVSAVNLWTFGRHPDNEK